MITNHFKVLFFLIFINTQCYAFDAFVINEKTSLFSANHMTSPVIQAGYVGWKAGWDWAGATINPEYTYQQTPYSGSTFSGRVDNLDINFTGEVIVSDKQIDWVYQWNKGTDIPDAIGFGIDFKIERYSLAFLQGSEDPELLPDNKGWRWTTSDGQTIEVTFTPALASLSFAQSRKNLIRALFFTDINQSVQQTTMTIKASQDVSISGPVVLDYNNSDPAQWHRDLLPKNTSPVDLSFLNEHEKPAGKHGFVLANKDELFFEDNTPVKFWGTNVTAYSLFSSSDSDIKTHAKRIAKFGYNLVRITHPDSLWVRPNIFKNPTDNTNELSNEALRKLDLWIKYLKAEGVYIWLDLHVGRSFTANDGIDNFDDFAKGNNQAEVKGFNYYNESIQSAMQAFSETYLNHVNIYTGLAYKDDPAIISMLITNENDLTQHFGNSLLADKNVPLHHAIFSDDVRQFSETYELDRNKVGQTWKVGEPKIYLNDVEHRFNQKMINHLEQLGVKSLIATTSSWGQMGLFGLPSLTDGSIIEVHSYGKSEEFKFNPRANPGFLTWAGAAQVTGKPLSFTEWNIEPFPATRDRFTAPIYTASIAKLQGWDAIMQYAYGQDTHWGTRASNYSSHNDPGMMALMPAASLLFRQDHVTEANNLYELKLSKEDFFFTRQDPRSSKSIRTLLETSKFTIGMPETPELPWLDHNIDNQNAIVVTDANQDFIPAGQDYVESDTQELKRNWKTGIHTINTEKSQIASGWIGGKLITLDDVSFNMTTKKAAVAVQSLENKPIRESNSIFITIVARSQPENGFNTVPFLSEPVTGQISVRAPAGLKLYPVNSDGYLGKKILINRDSEGKYNIDFTSQMKTHWFRLQKASIPFRITSPTNNTHFFHSETVTIQTNGSDLEDITQVEFFNKAGDLFETDVSAPFEYSTNTLPAGSYTIEALATFEDGTNSSKTVTFTVGEEPFKITSPIDGAIVRKDEPIVIKTNASSINGNIDRLYFWRDDYKWLGQSTTPPYEFVVSNLSLGNHILQSRVIFQDGTPYQHTSIKITVRDDNTLPLEISNIQVLTTEVAATITWDTIELSDSTVNYGLDNNYGSRENDENLVTAHSIRLTSLTANTEYHYEVLSTDTNDISNVPMDLVFTTSSAPITIPQISNIQQAVSTTTATITWDTDVLSDSTVNYGLNTTYGTSETNASLVNSHAVTLTGLTANTEYHYQVISTDSNGSSNIPVDYVFTTSSITPDPIPEVSNIQVTTTDTTATIIWDTDILTDSTVNYGLDTNYGTSETNASLVNSHSIILTGLTTNTAYHFQVLSTDENDISNIPTDQVFTTAEVIDTTAPVISDIQTTVTDTTAIITWNTNEAADSAVSFGLDASYGTITDSADRVTSHSIELTNLLPATSYHFEVSSADASANISSSSDQTFTTNATADITPPIINNIQATVTDTTATITWTTDENSDSSVNYGFNDTYGLNANLVALNTSHSLVLNGLTPGTDYHYEVSSSDASANTSVSADLTLTTTTTDNLSNPDLFAQWLLNEGSGITATDSSDNGRDGVLTNAPVWSGNELQFDGVDDYVNLGKLDISGSELTLTGWVQSTDLANCNSRDCRIISKASSTSGADHYWMLSTIKKGAKIRLRFRLKTNGVTTTLVASSGDLVNGERFHAAAVYDGTTMRLYKDGVEVGSIAKTGTLDSNNQVDAWIGGNPTVATSRPWEGSIADVRIYQKALTDEEVNIVKDGFDIGHNLPPQISNIQQAVSTTTATITWDTDVLSDSTVNYGLNTTYGTSETNASLVNSHAVTLTGLTANTEYHYQVISTDSNGSSNIPVDYVFTTSSITPDPIPEVSNIQVTTTDTTATIIWDTDILTDSTVNYGLDTNYGTSETNASLVNSHSIILTGLTTNTAYHFQVLSTDENDISNIPTDQVFTTAEVIDTTAPVISDIQTTVTDTTAIITWNTNEAADSAVSFGLDASYGTITDSADRVTSHSIELTNLLPATSYHFEVSSADASANISSSSDQTFTTNATADITPPIINNIQATVTDTTATITWTTDENSDSSVNYGFNDTYGLNANLVALNTSHSLVLNGLTPGTDYHYEVSSSDASANTSVSADLTLTTTTTDNLSNPDLFAQWLLNEGSGITATDSSDNGRDGVLTNAPVWSGNELQFDGVDDYVNLGKLDISGSELTLTGWVQSTDLANCNSRDCRIISKASSTSGADHYWMLSTIKKGAKIRLRFRLKTNGVTTTLVASSGDLVNGERFHAAAVYDGTTMRLYKDGVEVGSIAKTGTLDSNNQVDAWIGGNPTVATSRPWEGSIADVRIYQKALTDEEVNIVKDEL